MKYGKSRTTTNPLHQIKRGVRIGIDQNVKEKPIRANKAAITLPMLTTVRLVPNAANVWGGKQYQGNIAPRNKATDAIKSMIFSRLNQLSQQSKFFIVKILFTGTYLGAG
jgi:hypothetical protein